GQCITPPVGLLTNADPLRRMPFASVVTVRVRKSNSTEPPAGKLTIRYDPATPFGPTTVSRTSSAPRSDARVTAGTTAYPTSGIGSTYSSRSHWVRSGRVRSGLSDGGRTDGGPTANGSSSSGSTSGSVTRYSSATTPVG